VHESPRGIFDKALTGAAASPTEFERFASFLMLFFGHLDAEKGWTKQLHLGALRNTNSSALQSIAPTRVFDSSAIRTRPLSLSSYLTCSPVKTRCPKRSSTT